MYRQTKRYYCKPYLTNIFQNFSAAFFSEIDLKWIESTCQQIIGYLMTFWIFEKIETAVKLSQTWGTDCDKLDNNDKFLIKCGWEI